MTCVPCYSKTVYCYPTANKYTVLELWTSQIHSFENSFCQISFFTLIFTFVSHILDNIHQRKSTRASLDRLIVGYLSLRYCFEIKTNTGTLSFLFSYNIFGNFSYYGSFFKMLITASASAIFKVWISIKLRW